MPCGPAPLPRARFTLGQHRFSRRTIGRQLSGRRIGDAIQFASRGARRIGREVSEEQVVPLFNGKDLTGWTDPLQNGSKWSIDPDGSIVGRGSGEQGKPGILILDRADFADFKLSARVSTSGGFARIFVRTSLIGNTENGYGVTIGPMDVATQTRPIGTIDTAVNRIIGSVIQPKALGCAIKAGRRCKVVRLGNQRDRQSAVRHDKRQNSGTIHG